MSDVIEANIAVHSALAASYDEDEPHFRTENKEKVQRRLSDIRAMCGGGRLLDLGCGTGFIIDLARPFFSEINGVDITDAMLARVNTADHDIKLHKGRVEELPFPDSRFDAASAYSFLDHLEDPGAMLREAFRVLTQDGVLYIDLVPNRHYWTQIGNSDMHGHFELSAFAQREFEMVTENDKRIEQQYGIDASVFRAAEPAKELKGVDPYAFQSLALENGFEVCEVHFDWFLGNAKVLHQQSPEEARIIKDYLSESLPYSIHLFKYVWFVLKKRGASK